MLPIERVDDAALKALAGDVLRPAVISAILDACLVAEVPAQIDTDLRRDLRALDAKIQGLTDAVEQGGRPANDPRATLSAPWCCRRIGDDVPAAGRRVLRERAACRW